MTLMHKELGVTLLELLVTVSIAGILLAAGVPSMTALTRSNRMVADTNALVATLHAARSEALKDAAQVTVCKSGDQASCNQALDWHDGWIVFIDSDADGVRDLGGTSEAIIRTHESLEGGNTLQSVAFADWIAYRASGLVVGSSGNSGTFSLCNTAGSEFGRDISISRTGSASISESADGACP